MLFLEFCFLDAIFPIEFLGFFSILKLKLD